MTDRLFVAVTPPRAVVEELERYVGPRRDHGAPWRWTPARNWHVTLAFLGDVDASRQDPLVDRLAEVARDTQPFRFAVGGAHAFPNPRSAKALAMEAAQGADEIAHLARRIRNACSRAGTPPDGARFLPHLTLARSGRGTSARALLEVIDSFGTFAWDVDELTLIASTLAPSAARYDQVARFPLTRAQ